MSEFPAARIGLVQSNRGDRTKLEVGREDPHLHSNYLITELDLTTDLGCSCIFRIRGLTSVGNILGATNLENFVCAIAVYALLLPCLSGKSTETSYSVKAGGFQIIGYRDGLSFTLCVLPNTALRHVNGAQQVARRTDVHRRCEGCPCYETRAAESRADGQ
jgi:hypothetical protein